MFSGVTVVSPRQGQGQDLEWGLTTALVQSVFEGS